MRKAILFFCLTLSPLILSAQGMHGRPFSAPGRMDPASRTPVTGAPYSAVQTVQSQHVFANGNKISRNEQMKVYRDSQGRTRTERTITPPAASGKQPFTEVMIVDPVAGYRYRLDSSTMTAFRSPLPHPPTTGSSTAPHEKPDNAQVTTVDLGTQTINGVPATGTQVTRTIPAGAIGNEQPIQIVRTTWISTALKVPVQVKSSDPRFGSTDRELTNIIQAEPDPSLFVVPSSYTVKDGGFGGGPHGRPGR
jgi:hypothetical protein